MIFIVDDDLSVCRALKLLMETYGFSVKTFASSQEFLNAVPNHVEGCLILDIHMPGLNGWDTQKILTDTGSDRPVIIITADKNGGLKEHAMQAGAVGFLQKPFDDQELVALVNQAFLK